jgi:hypothetical protein
MYLSEEVASLCLQASHETDPHKLIELTRRIDELLQKQENEERARARLAASNLRQS